MGAGYQSVWQARLRTMKDPLLGDLLAGKVRLQCWLGLACHNC